MKLDHIARQMRRQAQQTGSAKRKLSRGLALSLHQGGNGHWQLAIGRTDVYPSVDEALIVAGLFGVPPGTDPEWSELDDRRPDGSAQHWYVITWRWIDLDQPQQSTLLQPVPTYP